MTDADPATLFEGCIALIPDAEADFTIPPHADDAIAAAAYALQAAAGLGDEAAGWASQRGTDALDSFLLSTSARHGPNEDQLFWAHPLVRAEVSRRDEDLATLAGPDRASAVTEVRDRASAVSLLPLDELDHES